MWGMMQGYGLGGGMGLGMAGGILLWGLVIVGIVVLARWILDRLGGRGETAMQILDKRYARGEISREEYEKMKREVGGGPPVLS